MQNALRPARETSDMTDAASLADRVREGDLRLHELEAHADADTAAEARRLLVESQSGASLDAVGNYGFPAEAAESAIENMVGSIQVPMGVAGPVSVDGGSVAGEVPPPRDHRGRALLASVNRGLLGHQQRRRLTARVLKSGMTRAPVFRVADVAEAEALVSWTRDNFAALKEAAEETTNHGELLDVTPYVVGNSVYLRFRYDTKDAMGMNMATIATGPSAASSKPETAASLVALSGNLCSDKARRHQRRRGARPERHRRRSNPARVVEERLHTTPEAVAELNTRKNLVGSREAASLGFNAHVANVVAAMFLATGQGRGAGRRGRERHHDRRGAGRRPLRLGLHRLLEVGTVGGGTKLRRSPGPRYPRRRQRRRRPAGSNADALARCIAVGSLAGELSLLSALASRHLSSAHAELGR